MVLRQWSSRIRKRRLYLRWDRPFNSVFLVSALFLLALFLSFCMMDTREYRPAIVESFVNPEGGVTNAADERLNRNEQYLEKVAK